MKKRLAIVLTSAAVAGAMLFGGWFAYHSYALQKPLEEQLQAIEGVADASAQIGATEMVIAFRPGADTDLRQAIAEMKEIARSFAEDKTVRFELLQERTESLEAWWSSVLFDIAEAMENRTYGDIPDVLEERANGTTSATAQMDDEYVYILLRDGQATKHVMLPRVPHQVTGWGA